MSWFRRNRNPSLGAPEQRPGNPTPQNPTLLQGFEWHCPGSHYSRLSSILPGLADIGVSSLWLPPGCKANTPQGNGYDCYDLWDLGEFDQKWTRSTKWGSREDLAELMAKAKSLDIKVIWDAVLNHKTAGDATEVCWAVEVDGSDRRREISPPRQIEPWIHYNFPGRGDMYSPMKWHWDHFNGTDWDQRGQRHAIFKIVNPPESQPRPGASPSQAVAKGWADDVDDENGNADYLMFSNIDYLNPEVREDVLHWGTWMISDLVGVDGFRLDAVQHFSRRFVREWIETVKEVGLHRSKQIFVVGEFWTGDVTKLINWSDEVDNQVKLFDAPLVYSFSRVGQAWEKAWGMVGMGGRLSTRGIELNRILHKTLVDLKPDTAVTVVMNHDTQPGQSSDTPIPPFFKPLAYAMILLREKGLPCVFYGDMYGMLGPRSEPPSCAGNLPSLMLARKLYAYGGQKDYLDSPTSIGWTRLGTWDRTDGCAVVMSVWQPVTKKMFVGTHEHGQIWTDLLSNSPAEVVIDKKGFGEFPCSGRSASVYANAAAEGRSRFPVEIHLEVYKT